MTVQQEAEPTRLVRPGGTGMWAPVLPDPRESQEWVVQADDDPLIVRGVD
ncbi:hypothetical protein [Lentzea sp.]|nr:hypothetical protein [Lentzea sp.]HUQ60324.1 hypothetical protein [Lentzea sp.]